MTPYEIFRLIVYLIGVPIIIYLIVRAVRKVREIQKLDQELREEEARNATNPYADLARMYEIQQLLERARGGKSNEDKREKLKNGRR